MQIKTLATMAGVAMAAPKVVRPAKGEHQKRQVVQYVTADAGVTTVYNTVGTKTMWDFITMTVNGAPAPTAVVDSAMLQTQVVIDVIKAQYTYSSAKTVFAVPTVITQTLTNTVKVTPTYDAAAGATVTPSATTTVYNTVDAAAPKPTGTANVITATATMPAVLVRVAGNTVTVDAQTLTYYYPAAVNIVAIASTTSTAAAAPAATTPATLVTGVATTIPGDQATLPMQPAATSSSAAIAQSSAAVVGLPTGYSTGAVAPTTTSSTAAAVPPKTSSSTALAVAPTTTSTTSSSTTTAATGTTSPLVASPSAIAASNDPDFVARMLYAMNSVRLQHSAPFLTWDASLATDALSYSQSCNFNPAAQSSDYSSRFGEALAAGTTSNPVFYVSLWSGESALYDYANPGFSTATGHFTQLVWGSTTSVGCGFSSGCGQNYPYYLVCRFRQAGNVISTGQDPAEYFRVNVLPN